jgi:multidrug resistance efflux pump
MRYINVFYIAVFLIGFTLWKLNVSFQNDVVMFYGFAETKETEINFNYPTAVGKIYVTPGQRVKKGEPLLDLYRIKSKEVLDDQQFKVDELESRNTTWINEKQSDIKILQANKKMELATVNGQIKKLKEERDFQKSLYSNLQSIDTMDVVYAPISERIVELEKERTGLKSAYDEKISKIESEIRLERNTYQIKKERLIAEGIFEEENRIIQNQLVAPSDGIVGSIDCKEEEHIPSYRTLITFYDPNPNLVKGYVHEDLIVHVMLKDSFLIRSQKDQNITCIGEVVGLGSRIVEIPDRLRKIPDFKTYGREVLVSIPTDNNFLQKEKVILHFMHPPEGVSEPFRKKKLVDLKDKLKE